MQGPTQLHNGQSMVGVTNATPCRPGRLLTFAVVAALSLPGAATAADAHTGVVAEHGEMVLLRDVSTRHAYGPMPPGIAIIVDSSPRTEINNMLGTGELSDDEYASLGATPNLGAAPSTTMVEKVTARGINGSLGSLGSDAGAFGHGGVTQPIGVHVGAVGTATRGIADQVTGALSHVPGMTQPVPGVPGG